MSYYIQLILLSATLISGAAAIFISFRLMRRYQSTYVSSYFYFLVFIYIFGVYSLIGSESIKMILLKQEVPIQTVKSAKAILITLGIPFLILSYYMFIRFSIELFGALIPKLFVIIYFLLSVIAFVTYSLENLNIGSREILHFFIGSKHLIWSFTIFTVLVFGITTNYILFKCRKLKDINQRKYFSSLALFYLVACVISVTSLHLYKVHMIFGFLFVMIFLGSHLVPLLFLGFYLQRYYVAESISKNFQDKIKIVIEKYAISNRESEIVELICKGMSNQEISSSLFISLQTVKDHVHRIFLKTGVKNRVQLTNLVEK